MELQALIAHLRQYTGIAQKRAIDGVLSRFDLQRHVGAANGVPLVGDDCAVIPRADGNLLFAIEGFMNEFVVADPWFAGWCGVMVNVSDIAAMGGWPIAVVDALWSDGHEKAKPVIDGMKAASQAFGVPIVGGHSNTRSQQQLAVAVLGQANALISSFTAAPGDALVAAIDLRGQYRAPFDNWNAATDAPPERLRGDIALLPQIAAEGLAHA
ncbi:MAG TPA: AIR synthase related protein, partial [Rhodocyclaceae bacterium]|nr:AIR synthase related protein [Rhodocyclaceae bacterium]